MSERERERERESERERERERCWSTLLGATPSGGSQEGKEERAHPRQGMGSGPRGLEF